MYSPQYKSFSSSVLSSSLHLQQFASLCDIIAMTILLWNSHSVYVKIIIMPEQLLLMLGIYQTCDVVMYGKPHPPIALSQNTFQIHCDENIIKSATFTLYI